MKKKIIAVLFAISLICLAIAPVAASPVALTAEGVQGTEARIVVPAPVGLTLGQLVSISWDETLVKGYAPHVDIIIDVSGVGGTTDALVVEYAYNNSSAIADGHTDTEAYGCLIGGGYATFSDDGNGPEEITDTANAWLTSGAAGGTPVEGVATYPIGANFVYGTIANWVAGNEVAGIDEDTPILRFEFEVDNWILLSPGVFADTTAIIDNIEILTGDPSTELTVTIVTPEPEPDILAISVDPAILDFGTVSPGGSGSASVEVSNAGTVIADVGTTLTGAEGTVFSSSNLAIDPTSFQLAVATSQTVGLTLTVPAEYLPTGPETATLVFEISAPVP